MANVFNDGPPLLYLSVGTKKKTKQLYAEAALKDIVAELQRLPAEISRKYQMRALKRAAKPGQDALRSQVASIGQVTGNLAASITSQPRFYENNRANLPVSVLVVGFRRPTGVGSQKGATPAFNGGTVLKGPNRAFHSHLVEYGTRPRTPGKSKNAGRKRVIVNGRINTIYLRVKQQPSGRGVLSSFKGRGAFTGKGRGQYPKDFIATGGVGPMPAYHPLAKAFAQSKPQMLSILDVEMRKSLTAAVRAVARQAKKDSGG